jgi:hypothetical protein
MCRLQTLFNKQSDSARPYLACTILENPVCMESHGPVEWRITPLQGPKTELLLGSQGPNT